MCARTTLDIDVCLDRIALFFFYFISLSQLLYPSERVQMGAVLTLEEREVSLCYHDMLTHRHITMLL
jgi:hypothetical protein